MKSRSEINRDYYQRVKNARKEDDQKAREREEKKRCNQRYDYWTFCVYPESAPNDWKCILDDLVLPWVVSPLHDRDKEKDGELKKSHWHVILKTRKKSYNQIKKISDSVCGAPPVGVLDPQAMCRYLVHMDHPEKYQYDKADIECHSGFDLRDWLGLNTRQQLELLDNLLVFCRDNEIDEYSELVFWAQEHDRDWFEYCVLHTYQVYTILRSWHLMRKERGLQDDNN